MTPIYTAQSTLDAQLVQDLLTSAGIAAFVLGPDEAGSIPQVPATGEVRVAVEDGEADLARVMIQAWETMPEDDDDEDDDTAEEPQDVSLYELDVDDDFDLVDSLPLDGSD
jgi:hypothetical protein